MTPLAARQAAARAQLAAALAAGTPPAAAAAATLQAALAGLAADDAPPDWAGPLREALLPADLRRAGGSHYTPPELADEVVAGALDPLDAPPAVVLDPACGGGVFLLAAARYLRRRWQLSEAQLTACLRGADQDALALHAAGWALARVGLPAVPLWAGDSLLRPAGDWDAWLPAGRRVVVTNPPFLGGSQISGALGTAYRERLVAELAGGRRGNADLCAYWLLAVQALLRAGDRAGLVCTTTIAEGATRRVGLELALARGAAVPAATAGRAWPGGAALRYRLVWLEQGGAARLGADLRPAGRLAHARPENRGLAYNGAKIYGQGFLLPAAEAQALIAEQPARAAVLRPYLSGDDLYLRPDGQPRRWAIDFGAWSLEAAAAEHPDLLAIVRERVWPERQRLAGRNAIGDRRAAEWWRFGSPTPKLDAALRGAEHALVRVLHTATHQIVRVPAGWVFSHALAVFPDASPARLALWQSTQHQLWALRHGSSLAAAPRYAIGSTVATFPRPPAEAALAPAGVAYEAARDAARAHYGEGLTPLWRRFHDPTQHSAPLDAWRAAQIALDQALATAYGWPPPTHEWRQAHGHLRLTLSPADEARVLAMG